MEIGETMHCKYFYYVFCAMLLANSLGYAVTSNLNTPPLRSEPNLKQNYGLLRSGVNQLKKYTGSKRPLSDQEWRDFKATAAKVGKVVGAIALVIGGAGTGYYLWQKRSKKDDGKPSGVTQAEIKKSEQAKLKYALENERWNEMIALLQQGVKIPKERLWWKGNILHEIIAKHPSHPIDTVVKQVIDIMPDINVNEQDKDKASPLFAAMFGIQANPNYMEKYLTIIKTLLDAGADQNITGPLYVPLSASTGTLLHAAQFIRNENVRESVTKWLLEKGFDPTVKDSQARLYTYYVQE
jgi:hypothetical protein